MLNKTIYLTLTLSIIGCAPSNLEQRLKRLESALNDVRSFQAEQTTEIANVRQEIRRLTGKTEEIEFAQTKRLGTEFDTLKQDLSSLKRRVPPPANVPITPLEEDENLAARYGFQSFSDALLRLREGNYSEALLLLQSSAGTPEIAANVQFWTGVAYDGMGENKNALTSYNDVVTQFPKHRRASQALLRQASLFEKIGDGKVADLALQKLLADYPDSPEAAQVKQKGLVKGTGAAPASSSKKGKGK